jgi:hypothetical protein
VTTAPDFAPEPARMQDAELGPAMGDKSVRPVPQAEIFWLIATVHVA